MKPCIDMHLHLGRSRYDGASLTMAEIRKTMERYEITQAVIFGIDENDPGPTYERTNDRVLKAVSGKARLIGFMRLNPKAGPKAVEELGRCRKAGLRGVKLHPRSENFSPREAEDLIVEIEKENLPVVLHSSHEENCRPLAWEKIFRRRRRIPFVLAHGGKDAYEEAVAVARRNPNVWLETSTLSYRRTGVILKALGVGRMVFGSDLPYSHPAIERLKLDLLLNAPERKKVYFENPRRILGE